MREGTFKLGEPGYYTVQNVEENDFLNEKLESDQYGIWYSVKFQNDASTHLWQTKTPPVESEKYWGWIEKTKSGKATKFKWDKQNAPNGEAKSYQKSAETEEAIARAVALKAAVEFSTKHSEEIDIIQSAETFLAWLKGEKPTIETEEPPEEKSGYDKAKQQRDKVAEVVEGEEVNLDDIPF